MKCQNMIYDFLCHECPEVPARFPDMFILMEPIGFLVIISLKSRFTADFLIIKIGCKKQDGRPEDGIFQDGSKIRSTDGKISNFLKIHNNFL